MISCLFNKIKTGINMRKINNTQAKKIMKGKAEYWIEGGNCAYGGCSADVIKYDNDYILVFNDNNRTMYYELTNKEVDFASDQLDCSGFYEIAYDDVTRQKLILNYFSLI